jgi:hypothetical protein
MRNGFVLLRRPIWLAWYPLRGRRCMWRLERGLARTRGRQHWHLGIGLGPLYLGLGPGIPTP